MTLLDVKNRYFPQEKVVGIYKASLNRKITTAFNISASSLTNLTTKFYQGIQIVETENYWFIDGRYKIRPTNIGFFIYSGLIPLIIVGIFFGELVSQLPFWFLALALTLLTLQSSIFIFFWKKCLLTEIYRKGWVNVQKNGKELSLKVDLPKYSKYSLWQFRYGNKLFDFIGITVLTWPKKITYNFILN